MKYVLTLISDRPKNLEEQLEHGFHKIKHVNLPDPTKYLSIVVAGSRDTRNNVFQAMMGFQWLSNAQVWGIKAATWQNLRVIVVDHYHFNLERKRSKDYILYWGKIVQREKDDYRLVHGSEDGFLKSEEMGAIGKKIFGHEYEDFHGGPESIYAIATIFNINILVISEKYGVELIKPFAQATPAPPVTQTVCLFHEVVIEEAVVMHYYYIVEKIN